MIGSMADPGTAFVELETSYEVEYLDRPANRDEDDWDSYGHGTGSPELVATWLKELAAKGVARTDIRVHELLTLRRLAPLLEVELRGAVEAHAREESERAS